MQGYASSGEGFDGHVEDWASTLGAEFQHAVSYVDTVVVPEIRRESAVAMRALAAQLEQWADKLDPAGRRER